VVAERPREGEAAGFVEILAPAAHSIETGRNL
jgi:hypothetical protein